MTYAATIIYRRWHKKSFGKIYFENIPKEISV